MLRLERSENRGQVDEVREVMVVRPCKIKEKGGLDFAQVTSSGEDLSQLFICPKYDLKYYLPGPEGDQKEKRSPKITD